VSAVSGPESRWWESQSPGPAASLHAGTARVAEEVHHTCLSGSYTCRYDLSGSNSSAIVVCSGKGVSLHGMFCQQSRKSWGFENHMHIFPSEV